MSKTKGSASPTSSKARAAAKGGEDVRDRIHRLTVRAIRDRKVGLKDVSGVVEQVLEGATQGIRDAVPASQKNVLRQVFDGLSEAVSVAAHAGSGATRSVKERGETFAKKQVPAAAKRLRSAQDEFLDTAGAFAGKLSGELREELHGLVTRARRAAPKVRAAASDAARSADGRLIELTGETAKAGATMARRAIGGLMMATGGLLEGLAESINSPKPARKPAPKPAPKPAAATTKSAGRKKAATSKKKAR